MATAFQAGLAEILEVDPDEIVPALRLDRHGWDSLAIISCVALIDECFGLLVSGSAVAGCHTVADLDRLYAREAVA